MAYAKAANRLNSPVSFDIAESDENKGPWNEQTICVFLFLQCLGRYLHKDFETLLNRTFQSLKADAPVSDGTIPHFRCFRPT
jgi:hypothetical protein